MLVLFKVKRKSFCCLFNEKKTNNTDSGLLSWCLLQALWGTLVNIDILYNFSMLKILVLWWLCYVITKVGNFNLELRSKTKYSIL